MTYQTLDALHVDLNQCRKCAEAGHNIESLPVFSGNADARLMLIGQAPGAAEIDDRIPFYGDAGSRLFRWLERAGWREKTFRQTCYITSVTKCFPGDDPNSAGDRVPTAEERKLCRPWLEGEITLVNPEVIVPIGALAVRVFYGADTRMTDVIGDMRTGDAGRRIIPLPHPSGASRWFNKPANVGRLEQAIWNLRITRTELNL